MRTSLAALALTFFTTAGATAQRVVGHDTLGGGPSAVTCGFCAGERFGVVFRELPPPARGIEAADFPFELTSVRVALASASVTGGACTGDVVGGTGSVDLEVYAGATPPSGDIHARPIDTPWDGEELIWAGAALPLVRSAVESEGSRTFNVSFNDLQLRGEMDEAIVIRPPHRYLRVVFVLGEEADRNRASCEDAGLVSPSAFPMRDDDGLLSPERNFLWGQGGLGWRWNEEIGVRGDWAVRVEIRPLGGGADAGVTVDAGTAPDAAAPPPDAGSDAGTDAAAENDAGTEGGGGGCGVARGRSSGIFVLAMLLAWLRRRPRQALTPPGPGVLTLARRALLFLFLLVGCASDEYEVRVFVRTDYVPATEFTRVSIDAGDDTVEYGARVDHDFVGGVLVATLRRPKGRFVMRVRLTSPTAVVAERTQSIDVDRRLGVTVVMTRYEDDCEADADCDRSVAACVVPACLAGECFYSGGCPFAGDYCDPERGCVPRTTDGEEMDAGARDAGSDAGAPDAGCECEPGTSRQEQGAACGNCGRRTVTTRCNSDCRWGDPVEGGCSGEGVCREGEVRGSFESTCFDPCWADECWTQRCDASCRWVDEATCAGRCDIARNRCTNHDGTTSCEGTPSTRTCPGGVQPCTCGPTGHTACSGCVPEPS